jgi:MFS family permease
MGSLSLITEQATKHNFSLYKLQYFAVFAGDALFTPFFALYFSAVGLTSFQAGILLGLVPFCLFLGDFFFGLLSTSYKANLWLMKLCAFIQAICIFLVGSINSFVGLAILISLANFASGALFQIQDGSSSICSAKEKKSFDSIRIYGSAAYALILFFNYFLLKKGDVSSYALIFKISSFFFVLVILINSFIGDYGEGKFLKKKSHDFHFGKRYIYYVIFYVLVVGSLSITAYYMPLYMKGLGLGDNEYSLFYCLRVLCQMSVILCFHKFIYSRLKSYRNCLFFGGALVTISTLCGLILPFKYPLAILYNFTKGFGDGFIIVSSVGFLHETLGDKQITLGITLASACHNLFCGVGNLVSPYIYTSTNYIVLFGILLGIALLGYCFLFLTPKKPSNA